MGVRWWQRGILYQVYPRSFADADGDGVGDLRASCRAWITSRAGRRRAVALADLSLADEGLRLRRGRLHRCRSALRHARGLRRLVAQAHARRFKVVLDFVPNHTSDQHPWFRESRASRASPRRDWYIWRDPAPAAARRTTGSPASAAARGSSTKRAPVLLPRVPARAARPQLAQSRGGARDARRAALLARARRRRLPRRRALAPREGRALRRQPASTRRGAKAWIPTSRSFRCTPPTATRCTRSSRGCGGCSMSIPSAC